MQEGDSSQRLNFTIDSGGTIRSLEISIRNAVIAGWTGRDRKAVEAHILELEKLGVPRPATTPIFYRVAAARLTTAPAIQVTGNHSSGEVETVVIQKDGELWVGIGSDHTDREVETYGVTVSKQVCDKPVAPSLWRYSELEDHWDQLILRSWALLEGEKRLYQEGTVQAMLPPPDLIGRWTEGGELEEGTLMFGGTLATLTAVEPSPRFEFEIEDPVLGRKISHAYDIETLPVLG